MKLRVIPVLLLKKNGLYKTTQFKNPRYVGDPINIVRIFNEKECDELVILDIDASISEKKPNFTLIESIASECFMPLAYGGGIQNLEDISTLFSIGIEKVILNSAALKNPLFVREASNRFGSQSIVVSVDVKKNLWGEYSLFSHSQVHYENFDLIQYLKALEKFGVGEIMLNSVDLDGTMKGYDYKLIKKISKILSVPLIVCGGAGSTSDLIQGKIAGASGVAAGSLFIYHGPHKAVLINYPSDIREIFMDDQREKM